MASAFAHVVVPAVAYACFKSNAVNFRLFLLAAVLSILPDLDVIAFTFGIPYESPWGHRGFTHSLLFAFVTGVFFTLFRAPLRSHPIAIFLMCFVACISHSLLDAMTNGGLGVALYWPFDNQRIFFDLRPIEVSPIGIANFFSNRGVAVLLSELVWVFAPGAIISIVGVFIRRRLRQGSGADDES